MPKRRKIPKKSLTQLKQKDLKPLRERYYALQNKKCPLLNCEYPLEEAVVDHCHSTKKETVGVDGKGLVRGVIHRQANSMEGKITNSWRRLGLHKFGITLPDFLRNLATFLENPPMDHLKLIHPTEQEKPKKLKKASYNKLKKLCKGKLPNYPKSGKVIIALDKLYKMHNLKPEFYK